MFLRSKTNGAVGRPPFANLSTPPGTFFSSSLFKPPCSRVALFLSVCRLKRAEAGAPLATFVFSSLFTPLKAFRVASSFLSVVSNCWDFAPIRKPCYFRIILFFSFCRPPSGFVWFSFLIGSARAYFFLNVCSFELPCIFIAFCCPAKRSRLVVFLLC